MVDEVEFEIMDADERRDTPVVIRWLVSVFLQLACRKDSFECLSVRLH